MNPRLNRERPLFSRDDMSELVRQIGYQRDFDGHPDGWALSYTLIILHCASEANARINKHIIGLCFHPRKQQKKFTKFLEDSGLIVPYIEHKVWSYVVPLAASWINTAGRQHIPQSKRDIVFNKTDGHCAYCGCLLTLGNNKCPDQFQVDHIVPWALGGRNDVDNLTPSCRACNGSKGMQMMEDWQRSG